MSSSTEAVEPVATTPNDRLLRLLAWILFGVVMAGAVVSVALDVANGPGNVDLFSLSFVAYPIVGVLLATKRPRNPLGWLMLFAALGFALPGESYARYAIVTRDGELPGGPLALAIGNPTWVPFIGMSGFMLLLFPDGHLPSPRWRWFAWLCGAGLVAVALVILLEPGVISDDVAGFPPVQNPIGVDALEPYLDPLIVLVVFAPLTIIGGAAGLIVRRRRTTDAVVREQIRWVTWGAGVIAVCYVLAFFPQLFGIPERSDAWENWLGTLAVFAFMLIPITIGIAVLRYRLYDIDVVIRKTVVYVVLAFLIVGVGLFLVAVALATASLFSSSVNSGDLDLFIGVVIGVLIWPLRRVAIRIADRIVYGGRASPYEVLTEFGDRLAGTYAADDVLPRTARVLGEGVGADRARVWLSVADQLQPVAAWSRDGIDPDGSDEHRAEVRHQGELLGALSVTMPANDPMDPAKEKLVADLAAQAGLLLRNVGLVEELRASRRRLVTAQDEQRRKLERDIHDGAQQQLVALAVKTRLARGLTERAPARTAEVLAQIEQETQQALEDLRDLARGIYPPLLADRGLAAAIEAQGRRSTVPVTVRADGLGRYPRDVEAAAYFCVLEALQNVAKYARATSVTVTLTREGEGLSFQVADDGVGFDPSVADHGTGLQGMADRLGALDGSVQVVSSPGAGTTVRGHLPMARRDELAGSEVDGIREPDPVQAGSSGS